MTQEEAVKILNQLVDAKTSRTGVPLIPFEGREAIQVAIEALSTSKLTANLEDAVECVVENWNPEPHPEITIPLNPEVFGVGDKVRVIVIKED